MKRRAVRIHHPDLRSCIFTVTDVRHPYPDPFPCPMCGITHLFKTHHLNLDQNGDVAVSEEMLEVFRAGGIAQKMKATKEVVPRPTVLMMPDINIEGQAIHPQYGPVPRSEAVVYQPADVISEQEGLVKEGGATRLNSVLPPQDRFRQMPDGTWEEIGETDG
jgi:hypothetical protein